jgi:glycine cleavage system H lipoate-binding protein
MGMTFPLDRFYHRGHTWARVEPDGTVTVGLDDLGQRLLGVPDAVDLPKPGTPLSVNGTAFRVHKRDADVRVLSPVDGEVVETAPPDSDWLLRVKTPANRTTDFRHLLCGAEVRPWLMREMERLQLALSTQAGAAATLADGGVPVKDIAAAYPEANWDAVCGEMFLEP